MCARLIRASSGQSRTCYRGRRPDTLRRRQLRPAPSALFVELQLLEVASTEVEGAVEDAGDSEEASDERRAPRQEAKEGARPPLRLEHLQWGELERERDGGHHGRATLCRERPKVLRDGELVGVHRPPAEELVRGGHDLQKVAADGRPAG